MAASSSLMTSLALNSSPLPLHQVTYGRLLQLDDEPGLELLPAPAPPRLAHHLLVEVQVLYEDVPDPLPRRLAGEGRQLHLWVARRRRRGSVGGSVGDGLGAEGGAGALQHALVELGVEHDPGRVLLLLVV